MNMVSSYHSFATRDREAAMDYEPSSIAVILFHGTGRAGGLQGSGGQRQSWWGEPQAGVPACCMDMKVGAERYCPVAEVGTSHASGAVRGCHQSYQGSNVCSEHPWKSCLCLFTSTTLKLRLRRRQAKPWQAQPPFSLTF